MDYRKVKEWKRREGMDEVSSKRLRDGRVAKNRSRHVAGKGK